LGQIADYGWLAKKNDMNQFSLGFPVFWRDYERFGRPVATEHTMYSTTDKLFEVAAKRNLTNVDDEGNAWDKNFKPWSFKDESKQEERGQISPEFNFWEGHDEYKVKWEYNSQEDNYRRINGGIVQKDRNDDNEVKAKVAVIVFMKESRANDGYENNLHLLYGTKGTGKALIFQDGQVIQGTWSKKDRKTRMTFEDTKGKEIKFNRGQIWVEILPVGAEVNY